MDNNEKTLSGFFKRTIFQGLEKVDANQPSQRNRVYDAAFNSLDRVHARNATLPDETKAEQRQILHQLVAEIENINHQETIYQNEIQPDVLTDEADIFLEEDIKSEGVFNSFFRNKFPSRSPAIKNSKKPMLFLLFAALFIAILSLLYINFFNQKDLSDSLKLPYVFVADQELLGFGKAKQKGKAELASGGEEGILYEVGITGEDDSNRLDFLIRGDLGKQINALDEPVLVTFHIRKISKEDIKLDLLFRGSGRIVRKTVEIRDQNINEYFLVTSAEKNNKNRTATLIRLEVTAASGKFEEKPVLLLKKVVLSEI